MFRSLYLSLIYGAFLCGGLVAPFVLGLGYVWVDTFQPQAIAYSILNEFPVSLVMGGTTLLAYLIEDRRAPPKLYLVTILILLMAAWVTFTTFNDPVAPELARQKWDWAVKTILFSAFMPFLFRSRVQIEAFLLIYILSSMGQILPFAAKTIISGGGYGTNFGLVAGNAGLAEGSFLSAVAMLIVPILIFLRKYSLILPPSRLTSLGFLGLIIVCFPAAVGTYERTALVGMAVVLAGLWLRSRRRMLYGVLGGAALFLAAVSITSSGGAWKERMSTIATYKQDVSALTRILVWKWTLDFVHDHPFGGGFYVHYTNTIIFPVTPDNPEPMVQHGRAAHSIYFEVLGEHGWPGLFLFLSLFAGSAMNLRRAARLTRNLPGMAWCYELARALQLSLLVPITCGAFIGIAFQAPLYYLFALTVMLRHQADVAVRLTRPAIAAPELDPETGYFSPDMA